MNVLPRVEMVNLELAGKRVLIREDLNVPLKDGLVANDARIQAALPTIQYILEQNPSKLILMSHLGRPKGQVVDTMSLKPVSSRLSELLNEEVAQLEDCVGDAVKESISNCLRIKLCHLL